MIRASRWAIALLTALAVAGGASAKPVGSPPIVVDRSGGGSIRTQTFQGDAHGRAGEMSIAARHRLFAGRTEALPAADMLLECTIAEEGVVRIPACNLLGEADEAAEIRLTAMRRHGVIDDMPVYPRQAGRAPLVRKVRLTLHVDAIAPPPRIDLSRGPLVDSTLLPELAAAIAAGKAGLDYPEAAMLDEVQGRMTLECQVQADLSLICKMAAFDPYGSAYYFREMAKGAFSRIRVRPKLENGESAIGVRTRILFRMMIS